MSELSKADVVEVLGARLGDASIADIIGTGIEKDQLIAARDRVLHDRAAHDPGAKVAPGPFARVVDILERLHTHGLVGKGGSRLE